MEILSNPFVLSNIFQKWYKDTHKQVVAVQVDGFPGADEESVTSAPSQHSVSTSV